MFQSRLSLLNCNGYSILLFNPKCFKSGTSQNISRQGKIMNKLFGNRISGSKKRWYPESGNNSQSQQVTFQASQFGKSARSGAGKQTSRRMSVLNKLFMSHITDMLATGEASDVVLGRGLQVSHVKISQDFSCINVYWLGSNEQQADTMLEEELKRCSSRLRHELSQLRLMGEVPHIKFVHDKTNSNAQHVENILRTMSFDTDHTDDNDSDNDDDDMPSKQHEHFSCDIAKTLKQEFYGNAASSPKEENLVSADAQYSNLCVADRVNASALPEMRRDVLGLDHRDIMSKILTKMRKSKEAWDMHNQAVESANLLPSIDELNDRMLHQLTEAAPTEDKFGDVSANRVKLYQS